MLPICTVESFAGHNSCGGESLAVQAARLADSLEAGIRVFLIADEQNLGDLDMQIKRQGWELLRLAAEKRAQKKAGSTPPTCPVCG
jgi:hypothetical protein